MGKSIRSKASISFYSTYEHFPKECCGHLTAVATTGTQGR